MKPTQVVPSVLVLVLALGFSGCASGPATAQKPSDNKDVYPLDVCVVTGEKLGSMGKPFEMTVDGKTVKLCCSSCVKDFAKDKAKYMAILDEAAKKKKG